MAIKGGGRCRKTIIRLKVFERLGSLDFVLNFILFCSILQLFRYEGSRCCIDSVFRDGSPVPGNI